MAFQTVLIGMGKFYHTYIPTLNSFIKSFKTNYVIQVRQFSFWFAHGTLGYPLLEGIDYIGEILKEESSFAEQNCIR